MTRLLAPPEAINAAAQVLAAGGLVALPTETVYGLGADALEASACAGIFEAKQRPLSDPLIVHVPTKEWAGRLAVVDDRARAVMDAFWPGPLTIVLPRSARVPDVVTAGQDTVAMRMSAHPVFAAVAGAFGRPIAAPSANRFGRISPTTADDVVEELGGRIDLVVEGGPCAHGIESTIVLPREGGFEILRHGPVGEEELRAFGPILKPTGGPSVPGMMKSHYAPTTPLSVREAGWEPPAGARVGLLQWGASPDRDRFSLVLPLSPSGDLREAAANLYRCLRRLDAAGLEAIIVDPVPEVGLGIAIMDRLRKAAARE